MVNIRGMTHLKVTTGLYLGSLPSTAPFSTWTRPLPVPPSFRLALAIFEPNLFLYKYPNNLVPLILPAYAAYEYGTECGETSAYLKFRRRGITQTKEYIIRTCLLQFSQEHVRLPSFERGSVCCAVGISICNTETSQIPSFWLRVLDITP